MVRVRVIEMVGSEYCGDDYRTFYHRDDITDWEEVTEEELDALKIWATEENYYSRSSKIIIVSEKQIDYKKTIATYIEKAKKIKAEMLEREKKKKDKEERVKQRKLESQLMKAEKEKEKKMKIYLELKKELESNG
jgi:hypothetical protein